VSGAEKEGGYGERNIGGGKEAGEKR